MGKKNLTTIAIANSVTEAHLLKGKLETEGIEVVLLNESLINATGFTNLFGGIKLQVKKEDAEAAKKILSNIE